MIKWSYITYDILVNIGCCNGPVTVRRQAIIWTNLDLFSIGPREQISLKSNKNQTFSLREIRLKM